MVSRAAIGRIVATGVLATLVGACAPGERAGYHGSLHVQRRHEERRLGPGGGDASIAAQQRRARPAGEVFEDTPTLVEWGVTLDVWALRAR